MEQTTFSQKLKRLEEVVQRLESPDVELEEGLSLLEEGVALHKDCQQMLTQTQAKITRLLDVEDTASPVEVSEKQSVEKVTARPDAAEDVAATLFEAADVPAPAKKNDEELDSGLPF
jgi:exodeoxyribonuclease VII small subunit